jgi:hypothetical protein
MRLLGRPKTRGRKPFVEVGYGLESSRSTDQLLVLHPRRRALCFLSKPLRFFGKPLIQWYWLFELHGSAPFR